jgi:hypothetical protein
MAYSRWSNSIWYTYWSAISIDSTYKWPTKKLKNSQVFEICDFPSYRFTYGELQDIGAYKMLRKIQKFYSQEHDGEIFKEIKDGNLMYEKTTFKAKSPNESEILELLGYIREWENDIEEHFKLWTFIKYEWWYPIRNKIIRYKL